MAKGTTSTKYILVLFKVLCAVCMSGEARDHKLEIKFDKGDRNHTLSTTQSTSRIFLSAKHDLIVLTL